MQRSIDSDPTLLPVPFTIELGRIAATGLQAAKGGVRVAVGSRKSSTRLRAAKELRNSFAALGPTYVKLGQIIASSPGVFPEVVSNEFRTLLDRVPPAENESILRVLRDELGTAPEGVFAFFDPEPMASASIAQVHRATLHTGEDVVVKIQRPGIKLRLAADLQILKRIAAALERSAYGRMANVREVVEDFAGNLREELDFAIEGRSMEEWYASVADSEFADRVRVPKVHWQHTTSRVLTMEYIDATRIDNIAAIRQAGFDGTQLVKTLLLSLLESAFHGGLFHGDLHAGNVLVDDAGRLVFLDFGIVGRFDPPTRVLLRQLVGDLLVNKDFDAAGRALYKMGAVGRPGTVKQAGREIRKFTNPLVTTDLGSLSYTDLGRQLSSLAKKYDAKLPRELVLVAKQLLYVERYMKLLAPQWEAIGDIDLFTYMVNILNESAAEREHAE
jgi:ubiquinone biosynthesis protein